MQHRLCLLCGQVCSITGAVWQGFIISRFSRILPVMRRLGLARAIDAGIVSVDDMQQAGIFAFVNHGKWKRKAWSAENLRKRHVLGRALSWK